MTPTSGSGVPKHRLPNRRWQPPELQGTHNDENATTNLASLATPVSDKLAHGQPRASGDDDGGSSLAETSSSVRTGVSSVTSLRSAAAAERRARPPSAREEQQRSRMLRHEISLLRDEKLRAGSQPATPRGSSPQDAPSSASPLVPLRELEGRSVSGPHDPLERLRRMQQQQQQPPPPCERSFSTVMTVERASLLSFIAGEVRTR